MGKQVDYTTDTNQLSADPSAPASGYTSMFPKTDGKWYYQNSAGVKFQFAPYLSSVLTAALTGQGVSSTADVALLTLTVPANYAAVGNVYRYELYGTSGNTTVATNLVFWVKIGTTKITIATIAMGTTGASNVNWMLDGLITVYTTGASASIAVNGQVVWKGTINQFTGASTATQATTSAWTITVGFNFSVSNAANTLSVFQGLIDLR